MKTTLPLPSYRSLLNTARLGALALVCALPLAGGAVPPLEFRTPPTFPIGDSPQELKAVDVNQDGLVDLVSANADGDSVGVLLGRGDGTFGAMRQFGVGLRPVSLVVADFNGDGRLDVITANGNGWNQPGTLSVLLGNGDGTFVLNGNVTVERGPRSIVAADFNGDGQLDVAVAISGGWFETNRVNVLFGRGDGTFDPPAGYTVGRVPWCIAVGDFNGDGKPDLVTANNGGATPDNTVSVLLNVGDGTFGPATSFAAGPGPVWVSVADFNRDGKLDLAVADNYGTGPMLSLLLGRGDGTFNAATNFSVPAGVLQLAVGDFNRDSKPDIAAVGGNYDSGSVTVFVGNGAGGFAATNNYSIGVGLLAICAGDFNGDGNPDLGVTGSYDNSVLLMPGNGNGTFQNTTDTYGVGGEIAGVITGDFNQDGQLDIATVSRASSTVSVVLQQTNGVFLPATSYSVGSEPQAVKAGDFNNDGRLDLVTANWDGTLTLLRGRTTAPGVFTNNWAPLTVGSNHTDVAVGDFNGDNKLDLVTPNYYGASLSVMLGNGDGTFRSGVTIPVNSGPACVVVEDFNRDGKADIAVGYDGGYVITLLLGAGDGTFNTRTNLATWEIPARLATGDFNFDGLPDLVAAHYDWRDVSVMINRGGGQFDPPVRHEVANEPLTVAVGDFNGDNRPDVVAANYASVSVLLGLGDGTFLTATNYFTGGRYAAVGDFNGDGMPDIALDLGSKVGLFWNDTVPRMEISRTASGVRLAWPAWKTYQLQGAAEPANWQTLNVNPATYGNQYLTTNAPGGEMQLFRLKRK